MWKQLKFKSQKLSNKNLCNFTNQKIYSEQQPVQWTLVQRSSGRNLGGLDFSMILSCLFKNLPNHGEFVSLQLVFFRWHFFTHDYILLIWQFCQNLCYFLYWFHGQCSTNSVKEIFPLPMNTRWPMNC